MAADDEVIENLHIHQGEGLLEGTGQKFVGAAGLRHTGGMVVGEDHGRRVVLEREFDYFARVDAGLGQGAAEHLSGRISSAASPARCPLTRVKGQSASTSSGRRSRAWM